MMATSHVKHQCYRLLLIALSGYLVSACADIYQWQDVAGKKHFSDRAHENSKKVYVNPGYAYAIVEKVYDGDTVKLADGRKVRLLGINTPEVRHKNQDNQAGGEAAKRWLADKLTGKKVRLVTDVEQSDKYKRALAHLFTEDKEHINLQLVALGLAAVNIYPPNLLYADELARAGDKAEQDKRGIWAQPEYAVLPAAQLDENGHNGWTRITGKISDIRRSRKYVYLELAPLFQLRIEKSWLRLFPELDSYRGKTLEARGWLNKNRGGWSMLIRHPSALKVL